MSYPPHAGVEPRWPIRLIALCSAVRKGAGSGCPEPREELWVLLRDSLLLAITREAARYRGIGREDIHDLASAKALELVSRAERGEWDPTGRSTGEVVLYIRSTARRALLRLMDRRRGQTSLDEADVEEVAVVGRGGLPGAPDPPPERSAETQEFLRGLIDCLSRLRERARTVWVLRGIHDLSTREIAAHPQVGVSPGNVDVILMRVRATLRDCLGSKGLEPGHLPPGSFTQIWLAMSGLATSPAGAVEEEHT